MHRDSFIFYRSFFEAIQELPKEDKADVLDAICEKALNFKDINLSGIAKGFFTLIKPQIEANNRKYENGIKPKTKHQESKPEAKHKQIESKPEGNVNVNANVNEECIMNNVNTNDIKGESEILKPPKFNFKASMLRLGVEKEILSDWLEVRRKKRASNTKTSFKAIETQLRKSPVNVNDSIKMAVENDWKGFSAEWVKNKQGVKSKEPVKVIPKDDDYYSTDKDPFA